MCTYIGIEDLAANAIIELVDNSKKGEVLFSQLDRYGASVIKLLTDRGREAILILSKERTTTFLHNYAEFFELYSTGKEEGIRLRDNVSSNDLWAKFRGHLSVDMMKVFMDQTTIKELGVG